MVFCAVVTGAILAACQPAMAGSRHGRYQIIQTSFPQQAGDGGKIVILDRRTGNLWTWSEAEGTSYVGILATNQAGSFARIIQIAR